jgi:hypothetical protein
MLSHLLGCYVKIDIFMYMKLSKIYELRGLIWKNVDGNWCRICPSCNSALEHKGKYSKSISARRCRDNVFCHSCSSIGKYHSVSSKEKISISKRGKSLSIEHRKSISKSHIGKIVSEKTKNKMSQYKKNIYKNPIELDNLSKKMKEVMRRPDVRKKHIEALHKSKWLKVKTDKGQLELLEKWNKLGFDFIPNYQVKTHQDLFYVDGYDKEKNVILEYDSKYHNKLGQKEKDLIRQQKIIDILKPKKFWRYVQNKNQFLKIV